MNIKFSLTPQERDYILQNVTLLDETLALRFRLSILSGDELMFDWPKDLFIELIHYVEDYAEIYHNKKLNSIFNKLFMYAKNAGLTRDDIEGGDDDFDGLMYEKELFDEIAESLMMHQPQTEQELFDVIKNALAKYDAFPLPEFDGLVPSQVCVILSSDWKSPQSFLTLNADIPSHLLEDNIMLQNALSLLNAVRENEGVQTTTRGYLNKEFVKTMISKIAIHPVESIRYQSIPKIQREQNFPELEALRSVLTFAGLLRKEKNKIVLTKKAHQMLNPKNAGELFKLLFYNYFMEFNIGFLDSLPDVDSLQDVITYILFMIKRHGSEWVDIYETEEWVFPPFVWDEIRRCDWTGGILWLYLVIGRILLPLLKFGLVEVNNYEEILAATERLNLNIRVTPLFDALLTFQTG